MIKFLQNLLDKILYPKPYAKYYISEIDKFLLELDKLPGAWSDSRNQEVKKYQQIFKLRDLKS